MKPHFAPKSCLHLLYHMEKDAVKHILSKAAQFHFLFLQSRRIPESTAQKHRTAPKETARCFPFSEFYGLLITDYCSHQLLRQLQTSTHPGAQPRSPCRRSAVQRIVQAVGNYLVHQCGIYCDIVLFLISGICGRRLGLRGIIRAARIRVNFFI